MYLYVCSAVLYCINIYPKRRKIVAAPMRREQAGCHVDNAIIIEDSDVGSL